MTYSTDENVYVIGQVFERMVKAEIEDIIVESRYPTVEIMEAARASSIYCLDKNQIDVVAHNFSCYLTRNLSLLLVIGSERIKEDIADIDNKLAVNSSDDVDYYCGLLYDLLLNDGNPGLNLIMDISQNIFIRQTNINCISNEIEKLNNMKLISSMTQKIASSAANFFPEYKECIYEFAKKSLSEVLPVLAECVRRG